MSLLLMLQIVVTLIFVGAAVQKFTGKVALNWKRWGYSKYFMYATGFAELVAVVLLWWPGLTFVGAALMAMILIGALVTLFRYREPASHVVMPGLSLVLVLAMLYLSYPL